MAVFVPACISMLTLDNLLIFTRRLLDSLRVQVELSQPLSSLKKVWLDLDRPSDMSFTQLGITKRQGQTSQLKLVKRIERLQISSALVGRACCMEPCYPLITIQFF